MRVLHVIPSVGPVRGGPSTAVVAMVRALRAVEVDAEIAATNDNGNDVLNVPLNQLTEYAGVPARFFARWSPPVRPLREFSYSRRLARWLDRSLRDYTLVHVHAIFSYASTRAMRTARTQRVPYVCRPLGQLCEWSLRQRALKKRAYLALFEKANLDAAAAIHYTTRQEEAEARPLRLACPAFVLPHGVDLPARMPDARAALRQRLGLPSEARVVLFLSRLHTKKGLECLIPALARLRDDSFWFVLVGDAESPEYEAQVQALLQATGLLARTRRVPFATGEWKQALLQGADLFALTSHSENFGLAVLEAMGAGLPVLLTSGVALAQEVARHQAGEIVPMNQAAVADAARRLLADSGLRLSLGAAGRRLVEREYAWPSVATRLTEEYRRITSQTASTR